MSLPLSPLRFPIFPASAFSPPAIRFLEADYLLSPQPSAMPEIRSVRSIAGSLMTNISPPQFLARDPSSLSIEEMLGSRTSEIKVDTVRMELEEAASALTEEDQLSYPSPYLQYLGNMNIAEILRFIPKSTDITDIFLKVTAEPSAQNRAPWSTTPNWGVSQEVDASAASGALSPLPSSSNVLPLLPRLSNRAFFELADLKALKPISSENKLMTLIKICNWNGKSYFFFSFNFRPTVRGRNLAVRKVSFHPQYQADFAPSFVLYRNSYDLVLGILNQHLPPEGQCTVHILCSIHKMQGSPRKMERNDVAISSSFVFSIAKINPFSGNLLKANNLHSRIKYIPEQ